MIKHYRHQQTKRLIRLRAKIKALNNRPRLTVFRSNKALYAQVIDDTKGVTLASADSHQFKNKEIKNRIEMAKEIGKLTAQRALEKKIKKIVFDRGIYRYHGQVKALAEGAREGGLEF